MTVALTSRVAWRYVSRDFSTEKALEKYLHEHPQADKSKHQVVEHDDGEKKDESHEGGHGHGGSMLSRLKGALKAVAHKLKDAPKEAQQFVADPEHRKSALKRGVEAMKAAPKKYAKQLVKTVKNEIKEFKTASQGIAAVVKGGKPTAEQKHAIKAVATHMAITIAAGVLTTASPALATMAIGKAMGKHMALKAVADVMGDLHVLEEWGHIGHGIQHVLHHIKFAEEDEKASSEELLVALVMQHIGKQMKDIDDDTLAEGLGGDDEEDEGQQKQAARRLAARYLKIARPMMSPWGGEDHPWPAVPNIWDEEGVQRDRFNDVFVMRYVAYGLAGSPMLTIDTTPWIHGKKPEFTYSIQVFDEKAKSGRIPLDGYERRIPKLLDEALEFGKREVDRFAKQLDQLKVPNWEIEYDKRGDDLIVQYKAPGHSPYSDSNMGGSFYGPLAVFAGGKSDYDISYSEGGDYEGAFGVRELRGEVRALEDIKKVLKDAERMWANAEKQKGGD